MRMMKRILDNVGRSWDRLPKDVPVIRIQQGAGVHFMHTIEGGQLHLHSMPYSRDIPVKQSIVLEELSLEELVDTIRTMGYVAHITSEAVSSGLALRKAFTLMPVRNLSIMLPADITTFSSKLWETLYPIARLLEDTDNDMDKAIEQMFATSTRGRWLDYWASFFHIKREYQEDDSLLLRRMFMTIANLKTNNIAIEELVQFAIQDEAKVTDVSPALFSIAVEPKFIGKDDTLHAVIRSVKGAGIDYFLNFTNKVGEDVRAHFKDRVGVDFKDTDVQSGEARFTIMNEDRFGYKPNRDFPAFRTNKSKLVTGDQLMDITERLHTNPDTYTVDVALPTASEVYKFHRRVPKPTFFKTNKSFISSSKDTLYGAFDYDDILGMSINVVHAEIFPRTVESAGREITSPHAEHYQDPLTKGLHGFRIGTSKISLIGGAKLSRADTRTTEGYSMKMERGGVVVQSS